MPDNKVNIDEEKPPPSICQSSTTGILNRLTSGLSAWSGRLDSVYRLSSPDIRDRFRDNGNVLGIDG